LLNQSNGTVVADLQLSLDVANGCPAVLAHYEESLTVKLAIAANRTVATGIIAKQISATLSAVIAIVLNGVYVFTVRPAPSNA